MSFIWMGKVEKTIQINIQEGQFVTLINSKLNIWSGKIELELANNAQATSNFSVFAQNHTSYSDKKRTTPAMIAILIVVFICIVFIVAIVNDSSDDIIPSDNLETTVFDEGEITSANDITDAIDIPNVVGMDYDAAMAQLETVDVEVTVKYTYDNLRTNCKTPKDTVVNQSLLGKVEKGNQMILVVAKPAISINNITLDINYVGGVDTTIKYSNNSDKQIAYIYFDVKYYDRMGYPAYCSIKREPNAVLKLTGPVNSNENKEGYWEAVIYNSAAAAIQPQTIEVIFTDGTSQTITNTGLYWHTGDYYGGELHN